MSLQLQSSLRTAQRKKQGWRNDSFYEPQPERLEVAMTSTHPQRKEKIKHELREMLTLFFRYLAFFLLS